MKTSDQNERLSIDSLHGNGGPIGEITYYENTFQEYKFDHRDNSIDYFNASEIGGAVFCFVDLSYFVTK